MLEEEIIEDAARPPLKTIREAENEFDRTTREQDQLEEELRAITAGSEKLRELVAELPKQKSSPIAHHS